MTPYKKRILGIALVTVFLFSALLAHFFYIQVLEGDYWSLRARRQHYFTVEEPFIRGTFYSNASIKPGHPEKPQRFVLDVQKFHLHIDPLSIPAEARRGIVEFLAEELEIPPVEVHEHLEKNSRNRLIKMWNEREVRDHILSWWQDYSREFGIPRNSLFFVSDYQRSYPFGKMLGQVLHTVQNRRDEKTKQAVPTGGLELSLNEFLQGKLGKRRLMRSPRHAMELGEVLEPPVNGADVYLTINHYLQAIAEEELAKGVVKAKAKGGWAVLMDAYSGDILALAQYPFFSPSLYREYFNHPDKIEDTRVHALLDVCEPGSVMKPFTLITALMANQELERQGKAPIFDGEKKVPCSDGRLPGRREPMKDVRQHKFLNMAMAMQKSSNIYMAKTIDLVIGAMGDEWYRHVLTDVFGFGRLTGVELPAENPGLVPRPGKLHPNGKPQWSVPTPYSLAIGYNLQANSFQLMRAWALIANGGSLVQPTLIRKIIKDGDLLIDHTSRSPAPQVVSPEIITKVRELLRYGTMPGGTGQRANIPGFTEVGKSGTSRKLVNGLYSTKHHTSTFVGFAPADRPRFVLLVTLDEPGVFYIPGIGNNHHGGVSAAPIFREIGKKTLEYFGTLPDDPYGYPKGDPRYDPDKAAFMPETRSLIEKYHSWNK